MLPFVKTNYELAKRYVEPDDSLSYLINKCTEDLSYDTRKYYEK